MYLTFTSDLTPILSFWLSSKCKTSVRGGNIFYGLIVPFQPGWGYDMFIKINVLRKARVLECGMCKGHWTCDPKASFKSWQHCFQWTITTARDALGLNNIIHGNMLWEKQYIYKVILHKQNIHMLYVAICSVFYN